MAILRNPSFKYVSQAHSLSFPSASLASPTADMRARPGDGNTRAIFYHVIALCIQTCPGDFISKDEISPHPCDRSISLLNLWTDKQWLTKMNTSSPNLGCDWWNWAENSSPCTSSPSSTIWIPLYTLRMCRKWDWEAASHTHARCHIGAGVLGRREGAPLKCNVKDCLLLEHKAKVYMGGGVSVGKKGHPEIDSSDS